MPTVREDDGMALSSRNRYLDPAQRAPRPRCLGRAARRRRRRAAGRRRRPGRRPARCWPPSPTLVLDYLELTDPDLGPAPAAGPARLLVAARAGGTRLLDNTALDLGTELGGPR